MGRVQVYWKYEDEEDGEAFGPMWIAHFGEDPDAPPEEEAWPEWVTRSFAERHARDNGYEFFADDPS
jgi:hypothetical protein